MRNILALFATLAILVSGIHAGAAQAHENDRVHASEHIAAADDKDGSELPMKGDQHGCHHHCPNAAASNTASEHAVDYFANAALFPLDIAPLVSTSRAPPLNPPKA